MSSVSTTVSSIVGSSRSGINSGGGETLGVQISSRKGEMGEMGVPDRERAGGDAD